MDISAINEALQSSYSFHQGVVPTAAIGLLLVFFAVSALLADKILFQITFPILATAVFAAGLIISHNIWSNKHQDQASNLTTQVAEHYDVAVHDQDMNMILKRQRDAPDALYRINAVQDNESITVEAQITGDEFRLYTEGEEIPAAQD